MESNIIENRKEKIEQLKNFMIENENGETLVGNGKDIVRKAPGVNIIHDFADGIYLRRMDLNKDHLVVGAIHKHLHIWFLLKGGTMRLGAYNCSIKTGTKTFAAYRSKKISERHRHRYEVNNRYKKRLEKAGMVISGVNDDLGVVETIET